MSRIIVSGVGGRLKIHVIMLQMFAIIVMAVAIHVL